MAYFSLQLPYPLSFGGGASSEGSKDDEFNFQTAIDRLRRSDAYDFKQERHTGIV